MKGVYDMDEFEKQNEEFCKWLRDVGKLNKACANGKSFMINPKALSVVEKLNAFFKKKSDDHVFKCKFGGLECSPYLIKLARVNATAPWNKFETYYVATDEDGIRFSKEELNELLEIGSDIVSGMTFTGNKYDGVSITMSLENFYIEVPQT